MPWIGEGNWAPDGQDEVDPNYLQNMLQKQADIAAGYTPALGFTKFTPEQVQQYLAASSGGNPNALLHQWEMAQHLGFANVPGTDESGMPNGSPGSTTWYQPKIWNNNMGTGQPYDMWFGPGETNRNPHSNDTSFDEFMQSADTNAIAAGVLAGGAYAAGAGGEGAAAGAGGGGGGGGTAATVGETGAYDMGQFTAADMGGGTSTAGSGTGTAAAGTGTAGTAATQAGDASSGASNSGNSGTTQTSTQSSQGSNMGDNVDYGADQYGNPDQSNFQGGQTDTTNYGQSSTDYAKLAQQYGPQVAKMLMAAGGAALGRLGGAKPAGTTTTTQDLPAWLQPYAQANVGQGFQTLQNLQSQPSLLPMAQNEAARTIRGDYLNPNSNPYFAQSVNDSLGLAKSQMVGMYGGPAGQNINNSGFQENMARGLGAAATNAYNTNYQTERGRQATATFGAPTFQSQQSAAAFAPNQSFAGLFPNVQSTTTPYFNNNMGNMFSGALGGYALAGGLSK